VDNTENKPNFTLNTPTAIIVAGLIIAGAIVLTNTPSSTRGKIIGAVAGSEIDLEKPIHKLLGLNSNEFKKCLESEEIAERVETQYQDGVRAGVEGTPGSVVIVGENTYSLPGAQPIENIRTLIDGVLAGQTWPNENINVAPVGQDDYIFGNPEAEIKIVEFSDLECPFCKSFHVTLHQVVQEYDGKVAWIYRHFPIDSRHPKADAEAVAVECAGKLGGNEMFWKYIDKLFEVTPSNNGFDLKFL